MNRNIKYRAFVELNNGLASDDPSLESSKMICEVEHLWFDDDGIRDVTVIDDYYRDSEHVEFDIEYVELMEFTGLCDNNGIEIYEGDIIQAHHFKVKEVFGEKERQENKLFRIDYIQGAFLFGRINGDRTILAHSIFMDKDYYKTRTENTPFYKLHDGTYEQYTDFKVIGNIFENPELLEED